MLFNALFHAQSVRICGSEIHDMAQAPDLQRITRRNIRRKNSSSQCGKIVWFYGTNRLEKIFPLHQFIKACFLQRLAHHLQDHHLPSQEETKRMEQIHSKRRNWSVFCSFPKKPCANNPDCEQKKAPTTRQPRFLGPVWDWNRQFRLRRTQHRKGNSSTSAAGQSSGVLWTPS